MYININAYIYIYPRVYRITNIDAEIPWSPLESVLQVVGFPHLIT